MLLSTANTVGRAHAAIAKVEEPALASFAAARRCRRRAREVRTPMDLQKRRRVVTWISLALLVVSLPGMVFSRSPQRWGHFLAFGFGLLGLLFAAFVMPWLQRRADVFRDK